jgi:hypothetical protein
MVRQAVDRLTVLSKVEGLTTLSQVEGQTLNYKCGMWDVRFTMLSWDFLSHISYLTSLFRFVRMTRCGIKEFANRSNEECGD